MKKLALALIATLTLCIPPVHAADYQKGYDAYINGDYAAALIEFESLAEQGYARAQHNLGVMHANGEGVLQDYKEAVKWYRLAAKQGLTSAHLNLGVMYAQGKGVLQDDIKSHMWLNIAASNGDDNARDNRDNLATLMTSADISKAQSMAKECMESNYKNCGY